MEFVDEDEKLNDNSPTETYRVRDDSEKCGIAWGQRKLLLSLVSFLTNFLDKKKRYRVVYAGAAPGINIGIVSQLFPEVIWHLYDPDNISLKTDFTKGIIVYQKKFTDYEAQYWAEQQKLKDDIYFISDIRTVDHNRSQNLSEHEEHILEDMEMQKRWVEIIRPRYSQLKFRPPYSIPGVPQTINYFSGIIYKTPWAPQSSTETRLVVENNFSYREYNCEIYQSQMFYHNNTLRKTENCQDKELVKELVNDWDCLCELHIWKKFLERKKINSTPEKISNWATEMLNVGRSKKKYDTLNKLRNEPRAIQKRNT